MEKEASRGLGDRERELDSGSGQQRWCGSAVEMGFKGRSESVEHVALLLPEAHHGREDALDEAAAVLAVRATYTLTQGVIKKVYDGDVLVGQKLARVELPLSSESNTA